MATNSTLPKYFLRAAKRGAAYVTLSLLCELDVPTEAKSEVDDDEAMRAHYFLSKVVGSGESMFGSSLA